MLVISVSFCAVMFHTVSVAYFSVWLAITDVKTDPSTKFLTGRLNLDKIIVARRQNQCCEFVGIAPSTFSFCSFELAGCFTFGRIVEFFFHVVKFFDYLIFVSIPYFNLFMEFGYWFFLATNEIIMLRNNVINFSRFCPSIL